MLVAFLHSPTTDKYCYTATTTANLTNRFSARVATIAVVNTAALAFEVVDLVFLSYHLTVASPEMPTTAG
jgi:hypothetical protein